MIIKRDIQFTPANATRHLHIYLPESYSQGHELYPVMYFFDGHNLFSDEDATFGKSWGMKDFLESWGKDIIIVGLECGHVGNERLREYCPYTFRGRFWGTGIGGSSMGGLMALYGAVCFNDWFSKAACVSSTISPCMTPLRRDIKKANLQEDTRIYLSFGTEEAFVPHPTDPLKSRTALQNLTIQDDLREKGARTDFFCQIGGGHNEASWEKQVPRFMDFLWM